MNARRLTIAGDCTHHLQDGLPLYPDRFDSVLSFHLVGPSVWLAPVHRADTAWHIQVDGSAAYGRRFKRTFGFYEGSAAVVSASGWHHIDIEGRDLYAERYAWCGNYQGARCAVRSSAGSYFHLDEHGERVGTALWRYAGDYRDDVAVVQRDDGLSTHIDRGGALVHGLWFRDLDVFHKGLARARDESGWHHVNGEGRATYTRRFAMVEPFYNGQARVEREDGALEIIDERGDALVELRAPLPRGSVR